MPRGTYNKAAKAKYNTNLTCLLPKQTYSPCTIDWIVLNTLGCAKAIEEMLNITIYEIGGQAEIFTSKAWRNAFDINEPIYTELCHDFYSTYEFDEEVTHEELITKKLIKFRSGGRAHSLTLLEFTCRLGLYHAAQTRKEGLRPLDATTLSELIGSNGRLVDEDPAPGVPRVAMPRPPRPTMMGNMEIHQGVLERMPRRKSYHFDRYARVFEYMAGQYNIPLQGAYAPPGYDEGKQQE
ncbi:hypothetical protein Tco_1074915 [Tanacetum coccineum]